MNTRQPTLGIHELICYERGTLENKMIKDENPKETMS